LETKLRLLRGLVRSEVAPDLMLADGNGWTVEYTTKRYGLTHFARAVKGEIDKMTKVKDPDSSGNEEGSHEQGGPSRVRELNLPKRPTRWHERDRAPCLGLSGDGKTLTLESKSLSQEKHDSLLICSLRR
jgi:hypothetical protein